MKNFNSTEILKRMKWVLDIDNDELLGLELGKEKAKAASAVRNWRSRNNLPLENIVDFARKNVVSLEFLVFGVENTLSGRDERALVSMFRSLNDEKKQGVLRYLDELTSPKAQLFDLNEDENIGISRNHIQSVIKGGLSEILKQNGINQTASGNGQNNNQLFHGNVQEVTGFKK